MLPQPPKSQSDFTPPVASRPQLTVSRGGLYVSGERRAERDLESCFREAAAASKRSTNSKAYPGPMIAQMAVAVTIAIARRIAALIEQNWKGGGGREFGDRIGHGILTYNAQCERKYGRITKDSDRGAA